MVHILTLSQETQQLFIPGLHKIFLLIIEHPPDFLQHFIEHLDVFIKPFSSHILGEFYRNLSILCFATKLQQSEVIH